MQTPGHIIINVAVLGTFMGPAESLIVGALLPDVPIMVLYLYHRLVKHTPEDIIWSVYYQKPLWLGLVHGAHSIPLALIGMALSAGLGSPVGLAFFASILSHALCDLPVHALDAHRHFLPFSQYRYLSPFSYWDVRYHAPWVALFEVVLVMVCSGLVALRGVELPTLALLLLVNGAYVVHYVRTFLAQRVESHTPAGEG